MASQFPRDRATSMIERIKRLLTRPKEEWPQIDAEPMTTGQIIARWAVPLAAIGPLAGAIGGLLFGYGFLGFRYHPSVGSALTGAIISYVLALAAVWVMSIIIDALAPTFGGTKNPVSAMKVAAYASTAAWLAGIVRIIPSLTVLAIIGGLYSLYLLYVGLPILMKAPAERAIGYIASVIVVGIVISLVIGAVTSALTGRLIHPTYDSSTVSGTVSVPGMGSVDLGKLNAASQQMQDAANQAEAQAKSGKPAPVTDTKILSAMLPASVDGWTRGDVESESGGAGGIGGSKADAPYTKGNDTITLSVADVGAMGALAGLGAAFNVQSNKETAHGYDRTFTVDGRMTQESWDSNTRNGSVNVVVGNRYTVSAEGTAPDGGDFRKVAGAIDLGKLDAMAKAQQ